ncbi:MAG: ATPase [Actinomycetota bacterium]|nr:ATPase [Actinomycetota bacterium]
MPSPFDPSVRLHVVTGKGGTGKTVVAAALALALAEVGRRVLLVEVEGRQSLAPVLGVAPLAYEERVLPHTVGGGRVSGQAVDAESALLEYLELFYALGRSGRALRRAGALALITTIAPGARDQLLAGKVYEAVRRRGADGSYAYDAVVLDAPPTGRIARFLTVSGEVAALASRGPIGGQAASVLELLRSPATAVHLVTLLEEMPAQETRDAAAELRAAGLPLGALVVNRVRAPLLPPPALLAAADDGLDAAEIAAGLRAAGLNDGEATLVALLQEAAEHARRALAEQAERAALDALEVPVHELPLLHSGVDPEGLQVLAGLLRERVAA